MTMNVIIVMSLVLIFLFCFCLYYFLFFVFFFFFQAEDGIRDVAVTGVQTCALPIWLSGAISVCYFFLPFPSGVSAAKTFLFPAVFPDFNRSFAAGKLFILSYEILCRHRKPERDPRSPRFRGFRRRYHQSKPDGERRYFGLR